MHSTDEAPEAVPSVVADAVPEDAARRDVSRSSRSPVSVALLAALACIPIVVAAGFLTDRRAEGASGATAAAVPGDISVLALRGRLDAAADRRPDLPVRAGY